jgi:hypothetical protein
MSRRYYRVNADPVSVLEEILADHSDFNADRDSIRGRVVGPNHFPMVGRLPEEYVSEYLDARKESRLEYVVYSYSTPIAYRMYTGRAQNPVYASNGKRVGWSDYLWVVPNVRYSVTTSKHQGKVLTALSQISTSVRGQKW